MVFDAVAISRGSALMLVSGQRLGIELRRGPHLERLIGCEAVFVTSTACCENGYQRG
jgi:hypothetical protein